MKIVNTSKSGNTISLEIEQSPETVKVFIDKAFNKVARDAKLPGFRKGKVPKALFERHFGRESMIREGLMDAVNAAYAEAVQALSLKVIDYPKNIKIGEFEENTPISFSCDVELLPEVTLGAYKGIDVAIEKQVIDDAAVAAQLDKAREGYATFEPVERAAQADDVVRLSIKATIDGEAYPAWTRDGAGVRLGTASFGADFDTQVIGLSKGDQKAFTALIADDFHNTEVAGKAVEFDVTIEEVREKQLPELSDELAKKIAQVDTLADWQAQTRAQLEKQATETYDTEVKNHLIETAVQNATLEVQDILIQREIQHMVQEFESNIRRIGYTLDQYLQATGTTIQALEESYVENAKKRVYADLVLSTIADTESIEATDADVLAEIKGWNAPDLQSEKDIQKYLKRINVDAFKFSIRRKLTLDFLVAQAAIK